MSGQTYQHEHRVSYAECTMGNHVYYARYLDILEVARGEFFRAIGLPFLKLQQENLIFPVIECQMRFKAAARYDDVLSISIGLNTLDRVRIGFSYQVNNQAGKLILEASTTHACTTIEEKPVRLPEGLRELLAPYVHESVSFS